MWPVDGATSPKIDRLAVGVAFDWLPKDVGVDAGVAPPLNGSYEALDGGGLVSKFKLPLLVRDDGLLVKQLNGSAPFPLAPATISGFFCNRFLMLSYMIGGGTCCCCCCCGWFTYMPGMEGGATGAP
ncbi:hypothetical protein H257_17892 [Aphanomyces astaci]|uniref:Uncharacterized protein n=1 Tax=Aphanomyces astaci TaxID=112090 RepID=W4FEW1_APHAT|nr:hypothetical protein H257_17892 [Aphanomyces astaci]ETV65361.1 hypothetical protein H257_17892 [Aphanomyces astaci]|eukprot:XP_009845156.1 hypothetical protein H257_17892 [Aphanomyces astaci]